ncbi:long-chain-fatty-acid--CoA ligase [Rossellomorea vietnamensis]|uniref:Long-chain-fatty-acid--CoA ligase n=1 Tax=Rossellomorea vietnamensis TaxID=218284 RepID=A0A5D4NM69_9BACI|nr:long-chain-fatty-acid--CoA ligase [Rossellomorea vietnamensis]TYS14734.1 long-chain-fatty-acid--CoA ligase [Rossellomorea vietnamensis]
MNISNLLERNARKYPYQEAIISGEQRVNYFELDQQVNKFASALKQQGISAGDKVVLFMPNTPEFVIAYFAVLRLGGIIVPVNAKLTGKEVHYILEHSDARAFIAHELLFDAVSGVQGEDLLLIKTGKGRDSWKSFEQLLANGESESIACTLSEDDEATILYTSGTTGKPKGVLFTYRNILSAAIMMCVEMEMKPESRILHMMPLSHSAPLHLFLVAGTYVGASHVLSPTFTPEALLRLVEGEKVTHFFGAPVAYLFTAKMPTIESYDLSFMKFWVYGGAPLSQPEVALIKEKFNTDRLCCVYGLTEAGPTGTLLLANEHSGHAGSIGKRGALGTEIMIADDEGKELPPGEVGEILLYGEGNMKGYYKDSEKTNEAYHNGWLRTGDLARRDEEGYIWIVDRKKDLIISGGVNIYPKEVEEALIAHPAISEAAVIGVPHPEWGETVKAYIVSNEKFEDVKETCQTFLSGKLAFYKIPKLYEAVTELPRNATGKILKQVLRDGNKSGVAK